MVKYKIFPSLLFKGILNPQVWMSHGDEITKPPKGFEVIAYSDNGLIAGIENKEHGPTPLNKGNIYCISCKEMVIK